ncbi:unnamed protein product [Rotaria sp. Silwood1]|nr:unnamed protein product [Rotaria sp. Silwood1]
MASAQFQVLSVLCRIVRNVVFDAVTELSENIFVSPRALPRTVFDTYTATLIDQFKKTTLENFRAYNRFISSIVDERRFISALRTNIYTRSVPGSNNYVTFSGIYLQKVNLTQSSFMSSETCRCDQTSNCIYPAGIYNQSKTIIPNEAFSNDASLVFVVPRFQVGCVPQNALLQSTLQCFYNQSCLDIVITLTGALRTVSVLNISNSSSRFDPTTTISVIFDNLMLESWQNSTNFVAYFQNCAPKSCSYSYVQRFFFIYMITIAASLFGGLSVALHIVSPLFVKFILGVFHQQTRTLTADERRQSKTSYRDRLWTMSKLAYEKVTTFNLFKTTFTNDEHGIHSTRVYIVVLVIGAYILTIYSTKVIGSKQIIVENPSMNQFEELYKMYSSILSCPSRRLSMPRSTFMHYEVQFHPFCTSSFVRDERWLQYWTMKFLNGTIDPTPSFHGADFRKNGLKFFNYFRILCDFITTIASDVLNAFDAENYFSSQPITKLEFEQLTHNWTDSLKQQLYKIIWSKYVFVIEIIQQSKLVSFDSFNPTMISKQINSTLSLYYVPAVINTSSLSVCSCSTEACLQPLGFYCYSSSCVQTGSEPAKTVPGIIIGCQPLYFIISTLECFFSESCVHMLIKNRLYGFENVYLPIDLTYLTALDPDDMITFKPGDFIRDLMLASFIDQWIQMADYESYYAQCQPEMCIYTIDEKLRSITVVNSVIGLLGG